MEKNKCECNRNATVKSVYGDWYCWTCFSHLEEEQSVRKQEPPVQED